MPIPVNNKSEPIILEMSVENDEKIYNHLYIVIAKDMEGREMFRRFVPEENRSKAIRLATFKENNVRSYNNQLQRSQLQFSVKELKSEPGRESLIKLTGRLSY